MASTPFQIEKLHAELERSLGFRIRSLKRLGGAASLNFKAVRDSDGMPFAVKCSPPKSQPLFDSLIEHLDVLNGTKAVQRVFKRECIAKFQEYNVLCTAWCDGERMMPHELTDEQFLAFLGDCLEFSKAMQRVKTFCDKRPYLQWRNDAQNKSRGLAGIIMRGIWPELRPSECAHNFNLLRIIHSDFHQGNFLFKDGCLDRILDIEGLRQGYPAEDIVRYIVCSADHLHLNTLRNRRRIFHKFALAVRHLPYSRHEWELAINGNFLRLVYMRTRKCRKIGFWRALGLRYRYRLYRQMKSKLH